MKILYIVQHFNTPLGSAGLRPYKMAKALVDSGHEVILVCGSYSGGNTGLNGAFNKGFRKGIVDGISIIEFDLPYSNNLNFIKRLLIFIKFSLKTIKLSLTIKYDIIFASSTPLTVSIPGIFAKWFRNKTFVLEIRDLWPELPKAMGVIKNPIILGLISFLELISYKSANRLIGLSSGIVKGIEKRGIHRSKIICIPNGCDIDIFTKNINIENRPVPFDKNDFLCIYSGTHGVANGLDSIIHTAEILKILNVGDIKFILIGSGKNKDQLIKNAKDRNLSNIIFLSPVNKNELSELLSISDIGLQILANVPAFYNGTSPNKFFDYLSAGLPVLCNYPGWIEELISNNNCGVSVKPDDPNDFAQKLIYLKENKILLNEMSINSFNLAKVSFNREYLSKKWVNWVLYELK